MKLLSLKRQVMYELEEFPIGSTVMTPTGRIGIVVKHHTTSKIDHFERVSISFGKNPRNGVVLQPRFLTMLNKCNKPKPDLARLVAGIEERDE